jgi:uncharacterized protein
VGERTGYAPGTFCWADLATRDAEGAKAFYTELLGWEPEDVPVGDGGTYTMLRVDGKSVCALYEPQAEAPPAWLSYVSVEDADTTAGKAIELGAAAISDPFDILTIGRMAVLRDPQGAVFAIWQARDSFGAELVNDPGAMCLNQLNVADREAALDFYPGLFGWRIEQAVEEPPYWGIYNGEHLNGGMMDLPPGGEAPAHWLVYFTTSDIDGAARRIGELGGQVVVPPMPIPSGRILVARDPQGAVFALFEGRVDP